MPSSIGTKPTSLHIAEHDITPEKADEALDIHPIDLDFQLDTYEERLSQLGRTAAGRILVVVSTLRQDKIRVVTAFPASRRRQQAYLRAKGTTRLMIKLDTPNFQTEAEEAKWWFDHDDEIADHFEQAAAAGTLGHGTAMRRLGLLKTTVILRKEDSALASAQAEKRGIGFQAYLNELLHEALAREAQRP